MNEYAESVIRAANSMRDYPYELGGRGGEKNNPPFGIDCRGFVQRAFKLGGAWALVGQSQGNVRAMVKWAKANGRFRGPEIAPARGWVVFYCEPLTKPEPGNPDHIRHVGLVKQPISHRFPKGRAMSALNPTLDILNHGLNLKGLAIYGYVEPDWASLDAVEVPITDPEPPIGVNP